MILPARRSFYLIAANLALAILVSLFPSGLGLWYGALGLSLSAWLVDALLALRKYDLTIERFLASSLPVGIKHQLRLRIRHTHKQALSVMLYDHYPAQVQAQGLPLKLSIPAGEYAEPRYSILPLERGKYRFPKIQVRVLSPLQLWWHDYSLAVESEIRIYPNFAALAQYALLATDNHLSHLGIMKRRRRGEGQDFHQLREYRAGDSLRQIDWKASARMHKAISREYQDERDQDIIFLIDCGHRMQAKDGELSHFDHTLNAVLLMAYVALKQGDAVGLATFGGTERWLPAKKGQLSLNQILNTLYDLQPSLQAPDYSQAAAQLLIRHKKRALVILISNLRDEDTDDLLPALNLLRKRHLLLLASMREQALDQALEPMVDQLEVAIEQAATQHYLHLRQQTLERVRATGSLCLDVPPTELSSQLINRYLEIKRSGVL